MSDTTCPPDFEKALAVGRPPNVVKLFPHSKALLVSGKVIDRAMREKGKAMTIAANCRSHITLRGVLRAAKRADAAVILEIARSEGGANAYCPVSLWNLARQADAVMNELGVAVPVAIHADHYGIKAEKDLGPARVEIPSLFDAGVTSIAIDASHLPDAENLAANIALSPLVPAWAGYETEVGEIKGASGLSTPAEALFLIAGLNAHGIHPDWIALNNGTTHGIEASASGIQVELTASIHAALAKYGLSGAQHGTSGNSSERLREIAAKTATTKANVATALQMISWGVKVNDYGNAILDASGDLVKVPGQGVSEELWAEMKAYADAHGIKGGNYKKLNIVFENKILGQAADIRERMVQAVEDFVYGLLADVFNASGTGAIGRALLAKAGTYDLGPKAARLEDPAAWTPEKAAARAKNLSSDKGLEGDFDD
ncbi:class II fructose-bisphosphate aldolase [Desulfovibrio sulfodismutans]|uniref:Class II fructose-bisphosphate aldolase n=1 Tax=Desulfolutivibrio sulfodismutans TaxID=63561 RepID=A0A7K3NKV6_9BACT|nr:class II fructose-bisphosphate aldolase [Desulfolutivibrio sulfodismutans]NDY56838.1 class II fructose-bisphosphate aldolase [Desulfolutivibrio sulfodismutans]QLA13897.1 ketose-bisphosphate aldolase [Desulfolutivibrio sulfodismutans DSM 3696]